MTRREAGCLASLCERETECFHLEMYCMSGHVCQDGWRITELWILCSRNQACTRWKGYANLIFITRYITKPQTCKECAWANVGLLQNLISVHCVCVCVLWAVWTVSAVSSCCGACMVVVIISTDSRVAHHLAMSAYRPVCTWLCFFFRCCCFFPPWQMAVRANPVDVLRACAWVGFCACFCVATSVSVCNYKSVCTCFFLFLLVLFFTTSHRLYLHVSVSVAGEKTEIFVGSVTSRGEKKLLVVSNVPIKICPPLWLVITGCIWARSPPACPHMHHKHTHAILYTHRGRIKGATTHIHALLFITHNNTPVHVFTRPHV